MKRRTAGLGTLLVRVSPSAKFWDSFFDVLIITQHSFECTPTLTYFVQKVNQVL